MATYWSDEFWHLQIYARAHIPGLYLLLLPTLFCSYYKEMGDPLHDTKEVPTVYYFGNPLVHDKGTVVAYVVLGALFWIKNE